MLLLLLYTLHKVRYLLMGHFLLAISAFALEVLTMCLCFRQVIRIFHCFFNLIIKGILLVVTLLCHSGSIFCGSCVSARKFLLTKKLLVYVNVQVFEPFTIKTLPGFQSI